MKPGLFKVKNYFEHPNADYSGNPLIEWLQPLTRKKIARMLFSPVAFHTGELGHPPELRIQYVQRLGNWFLPLESQIDFVVGTWDAVCKGLVGRNPLGPTAEGLLDKLLDFLNEDENSKANLGMNTLLDDPSCVTLFGTPGTGKSRPLNAFFSRMPYGVMFHERGNVYQTIWVRVCAPGTGQKSLGWIIYEELYKLAAAANLIVPRLNDRASVPRC